MSATAPALNDLIAQRARLANLRWRLGSATTGIPGAHRRQLRPGRGMEFAEVRPYQPGDDLRSLDWRHTARRGRPFTKRFHEERERPVLLFVDLGPTMRFGTRVAFKSVVAARAAALLAWAATAAGDRVGGVIWDGYAHRESGPRGREAGVLALIHELARPPAPPSGDRQAPCAALRALARLAHPGTQVVLIGDFHDLDDDAANELARLGRGVTLTLLQVFDALEATPPPAGRYGITDGRHEDILDLRHEDARAAYGAAFRQRCERLAVIADRLGATLVRLATDEDPLRVLGGSAGLLCRTR